MARKGGGPRQPLSQRRPAKAARHDPAPPRGRQKGPPTSKLHAPPGKTSITTTRKSSKKRSPALRRIDPAALANHAASIYEGLSHLYPDAHCELDYRNPFELLVATILSAQCTDRRVNMVTPVLFARYPTPAALAAARQEDVEEIIRSTGFFRNKARNLIAMAGAVVERHGGEIPRTMDDLV